MQINYEFSLMFENSVNNFLDIWPTASQKIIDQAAVKINKSPGLKKFISEDAGETGLQFSKK